MPTTPILVYDEECFFCSSYIKLLNLKASIGDITFVSARDADTVRTLHLEPPALNEGMVLILDGQYYVGAEAVHHLALLSTSSTTFNKFNRIIFRNPALAARIYPLLKLFRRIYLLMSGKGLI